MTGRRLLVAAIVVLAIAQALGVMTVLRRVDPVSVDDAVARFRHTAQSSDAAPALRPTAAAAATPADATSPRAVTAAAAPQAAARIASGAPTASAPRPATVPPAGVYVYRTSGFEELGIPGSHRAYPDVTTITVTPTPCGADLRWDAFQQRWDRWQTCSPDARVELQQFTTYHEFFNQVDRRDYTCGPDADLRPAAASTTGTCRDGAAAVELRATIVGIEKVTVDNDVVDAVHVRLDEKLTGPTAGTRTSDSWYRSTDGLLLHRTGTTDVVSDTAVGHTTYTEHVELLLTSLDPRT